MIKSTNMLTAENHKSNMEHNCEINICCVYMLIVWNWLSSSQAEKKHVSQYLVARLSRHYSNSGSWDAEQKRASRLDALCWTLSQMCILRPGGKKSILIMSIKASLSGRKSDCLTHLLACHVSRSIYLICHEWIHSLQLLHRHSP